MKNEIYRKKDIDTLKDWYESQSMVGSEVRDIFSSLRKNITLYSKDQIDSIVNFLRRDARIVAELDQYLNRIEGEQYHCVITYRFPISTLESIHYLNLMIHFMNRKMFGRKYKQREKYLNGFCVAEYQKNGGLHYHILFNGITANYEIDRQGIQDILLMASSRIVRNCDIQKYEKIKEEQNRELASNLLKIFDIRGLHVKNVWDRGGIISYLLKNIKGIDSGRFSFLGKNGVAFDL